MKWVSTGDGGEGDTAARRLADSLDALQTAKLDGWAAELAAARAGPHAKTLVGGYAPDLDLERMKGVDA